MLEDPVGEWGGECGDMLTPHVVRDGFQAPPGAPTLRKAPNKNVVADSAPLAAQTENNVLQILGEVRRLVEGQRLLNATLLENVNLSLHQHQEVHKELFSDICGELANVSSFMQRHNNQFSSGVGHAGDGQRSSSEQGVQGRRVRRQRTRSSLKDGGGGGGGGGAFRRQESQGSSGMGTNAVKNVASDSSHPEKSVNTAISSNGAEPEEKSAAQDWVSTSALQIVPGKVKKFIPQSVQDIANKASDVVTTAVGLGTAESRQGVSPVRFGGVEEDPDENQDEVVDCEGAHVELHQCWQQESQTRSRTWDEIDDRAEKIFAMSVYKDPDRAPQVIGTMIGMPQLKRRKLGENPVFNPSSKFLVLWSIIEGFLLFWDLVTIPAASVYKPDGVVLLVVMRWASILFWTIDVPVSCFKGYITKTGEVEMRLGRVTKKYLHKTFILDLVLVVIEYASFVYDKAHLGRTSESQAPRFFVRVLRMTRLLKVGRFRRLLRRLAAGVKSPTRMAAVFTLGHLLQIVTMCHLSACIFSYLGQEAGNESNVWDPGADWSLNYLWSLQWSISQLGFGSSHLYPQSLAQSIFASAFSLVCMMSFSVWLAGLVTSMQHLQNLSHEDRVNMDKMRDYLRDRNVSWGLRARIWKVLKGAEVEPWIQEDEVKLLEFVPEELCVELRAEAFIPVLTAHPFFGTYGFSNADKHAMYNIIRKRVIREESCDASAELFAQNEVADKMYFLMKGTLYYRYAERQRIVNEDTKGGKGGATEMMTVGSKKELKDQGWLSEASLWLHWRHVGQAVVETVCEMALLSADEFRREVQADLPEARRYAKAFFKCAITYQSSMNDLFPDVANITAMAQETFEPPRSFEIARCRPIKSNVKDEWQPTAKEDWQRIWSSPWNDSHLHCSSALISTMTTEMRNDIVLTYQTLFAQNSSDSSMILQSPSDRDLFDRRVLVLKRLFLCLAVSRVYFTKYDNGINLRPWPFPLASVFCHGGRVLLRLDDVSSREFCNFLLFGDPNECHSEEHVAPPLYVRMAASHGVVLNECTLQVREVKVGMTGAIGRGHLGMDLPIGGLGNPMPVGKRGPSRVGPAGAPYQTKWRPDGTKIQFLRDIQHGHLYMRTDDFGTKTVTRLQMAEEAKVQQDNPAAQWKPVRELGGIDDLKHMLRLSPGASHGLDSEKFSRLYRVLSARELRLETDQAGKLRCQGILVHFVMEIDDENVQVLVQTGASLMRTDDDNGVRNKASIRKQATHKTKKMDATDSMAIQSLTRLSHREDDVRVVTILCRYDESWQESVERYCKDQFKLGDSAITKLLQGCYEAHLFSCDASSSVCYHHSSICKTLGIPLLYDGFLIKTRIHMNTMNEKDRSAFEPILPGTFKTFESPADLIGFGGGRDAVDTRASDESSLGHGHHFRGNKASDDSIREGIVREWMWMHLGEPRTDAVVGIAPLPGQSKRLEIKRKEGSVAALLIGIENSAPLKSDVFGNAHNPDAKSKDFSVMGKRKWRDFRRGGEEAPADLGGTRVYVTDATFKLLQDVCDKMCLSKPSEVMSTSSTQLGQDAKREKEKAVFRALLESSEEQVDRVLEEHLQMKRLAPLSSTLGDFLQDAASVGWGSNATATAESGSNAAVRAEPCVKIIDVPAEAIATPRCRRVSI